MRMAVGKEAKELSRECHLGDSEKTGGGRILPLNPNPWEVTMKRRMKMRKRGR
jgi:hypothetical protein